MKILHAICSADPRGGGPVEGICQLGCAIQAAGKHQVEVLTLDPPDAPYVAEFPLRVYALGPGFTKYSVAPWLVPWLVRHSSNYDIVIVNGIWRYPGIAVQRAARITGKAYCVYPHGMLDPWFKKAYPLKHLQKWVAWRCGEQKVLSEAAGVLFTCEEEMYLARKLFREYSAKEFVVGYGTSPASCATPSEIEALYYQFPDLRGKKIVLFLSRIHAKKGCDLVIESFARVLGRLSNWHLVIAGPENPEVSPVLARLAEDLGISKRITWTGMVRGGDKRALLSLAEVFMLPSHQENFGIAIAEAMSYGVPPLISDKVNIWREIEGDGAGLVAEDTLEGACSLLTSWISLSDSDQEDMKRRARQSFQRRFEIESVAKRVIEQLSHFIS